MVPLTRFFSRRFHSIVRNQIRFISLIPEKKKIPITILSGFLGAGKTTYLQHILSSRKDDLSFGLVVNDMASVNIDSKLIRSSTQNSNTGIDTLELENGCVCCTLAEDLLQSINQLITISNERGKDYDHIIVECSGIAEPRKMVNLFQQAQRGSSILELEQALALNRVELNTLITVVDAKVFYDKFGTKADFMSSSDCSDLAMTEIDRKNDTKLLEMAEIGQRRVTDLLLEQVEKADVILINKCDLLLEKQEFQVIKEIVSRVNPTAKIQECVRGEVSNAIDLLGYGQGTGAVTTGIVEEHREMLASADSESCTDTNCTDSSHHHDHHHDHDHHHHHHHMTETETTAKKRFGITSFAYKRRRPFHPQRLSDFLRTLGNSAVGLAGISSQSLLGNEETKTEGGSMMEEMGILRSKGFVWVAASSRAAYFLSHAGQHLEMVVLGRWWADMNKNQWPLEEIHTIENDFDFHNGHGDRRQEIVFIGTFDQNNKQVEIENKLDECLLNDMEFQKYTENMNRSDSDEALRKLWFGSN